MMSDRTTPDWKPDILDAFDADNSYVKKGLNAEKLYYSWALSAYDKVENHQADQEKQNQGIDFTIYKKKWGEKKYTVDVKSEYYGSFFKIDNRPNGWLRNPKKISDRIVQVDVKNSKAIDFQRKKMIEYLDSIGANPEVQIDNEITGQRKNLDFIKINLRDKNKLPKGLIFQYELNETNLNDFLKEKKD
jgi:hypothetical protein